MNHGFKDESPSILLSKSLLLVDECRFHGCASSLFTYENSHEVSGCVGNSPVMCLEAFSNRLSVS